MGESIYWGNFWRVRVKRAQFREKGFYVEKDRKLIIKKLVCMRRDFFVLKIFMHNSRDKST